MESPDQASTGFEPMAEATAATPEPGDHVILSGLWNGSEGIVVEQVDSDDVRTEDDFIVRLTVNRRVGYKGGWHVAVPMSQSTLDTCLNVRLTEEQVNILLGITGPRIADPNAKRYNDWSIDLHRRLLEVHRRLLEALETR